MRHRRARLTGIVICATALAAASPSAAETLTYTTPGTTTVTLPLGVTNVHVVAVGGRGGGLLGGFGAVVTADVRANTTSFVGLNAPRSAPQLRIIVGGNGDIGAAGANGGGAAGDPTLPTLAGGGGGASTVATCGRQVDGVCSFRPVITAGGGGGAGADGLPGTGGAGGSAGVAGFPGSSTDALTAAGGGATWSQGLSASRGGAGSASSDPDCEDGASGGTALLSTGGAGGLSTDVAGHGDGGGGGGGLNGGGGGGGGAYCADDTGTSGGGGGGGANRVPTGAQTATDTTGLPSVTVSYELPKPRITILAPVEGAVYERGARPHASFSCAPARLSETQVVSCVGTVPVGERIDTETAGDRTFTVTAKDTNGSTAERTVRYRVLDRVRPAIRRLRIMRKAIDPLARRPFANVRFGLTEPARVVVGVGRIRTRSADAARTRLRELAGDRGRNAFRLRARIGRRTLRPGAYRLTLVAIDPSGNRSRPISRRFRVIDADG